VDTFTSVGILSCSSGEGSEPPLADQLSFLYFLQLGSAMSVPDREADENIYFTGEMLSNYMLSRAQLSVLS